MWHGWETGNLDTGVWWGDLRGKRPLGRPRHRWKANIKMDLQEVVWLLRKDILAWSETYNFARCILG